MENKSPIHRLIAIRHGQSVFNKTKQWAGWTDVDLSQHGIKQSIDCAHLIKQNGIQFDIAYTSFLKRTVQTMNIILDQLHCHYVPVQKRWRINQKHYGILQGQFKKQITAKYGEQLVLKWRRSMDTPPPKLPQQHPGHPIHDPRYHQIPLQQMPSSQCLRDVIKRVKPFYQQQLVPKIKEGHNIILITHGSVLRSLLKIVFNQKDQTIMAFNTPNVTPLVIDYDQDMNPIKYYLMGNQKVIQQKMKKIVNQTKL